MEQKSIYVRLLNYTAYSKYLSDSLTLISKERVGEWERKRKQERGKEEKDKEIERETKLGKRSFILFTEYLKIFLVLLNYPKL